jgi:Mg2+/Co2+ transporter CorB
MIAIKYIEDCGLLVCVALVVCLLFTNVSIPNIEAASSSETLALSTKLYVVVVQKTVLFITTVMRTSNPTNLISVHIRVD